MWCKIIRGQKFISFCHNSRVDRSPPIKFRSDIVRPSVQTKLNRIKLSYSVSKRGGSKLKVVKIRRGLERCFDAFE